MAKIITVESSEYQAGRQIIKGSIGKTETGKAMASADLYSPGGVAHRAESGEKGIMIPINGGRYNAMCGCSMQVELEPGESALFSSQNGQVQAIIICTKDGEIIIKPQSGQKVKIAEATDSAVLHTKLNQFIEQMKAWMNTHTHANHGVVPTTPFTENLNAESKDVRLS